MTSYKKTIAITSIGGIVAGILIGIGSTYMVSKSFDKGLNEITSKLSSEDYKVSYQLSHNSLSGKEGQLNFKSQKSDKKDFAVKFYANNSVFESNGEFYIPLNDYFRDNLNRFGVEKIKFSVGYSSGELIFDVKKKTPVVYEMGVATFLTEGYTGLIEFKNENFNVNDLILNLGTKEAVVKIDGTSWNDTAFSLHGVSYAAPIETFIRKNGDFRAPKYSHFKVEELNVVKTFTREDKSTDNKIAQTFYDVELYRRMQNNNLEANGLKFSVGKEKLGTAILEGTNTPVKTADFDLIDLDGSYQIKLNGVAFTGGNNLMVNELENLGALQREKTSSVSKVEISRGQMTFNGIDSDIVVNKLFQLNILQAPSVESKTAAAGLQGKAPQISVATEKNEETK